jgi:hypothetical protein
MSLAHRRLLRRLAAMSGKARPQVFMVGGGLPSGESEGDVEVRSKHGRFVVRHGLPPLPQEEWRSGAKDKDKDKVG